MHTRIRIRWEELARWEELVHHVSHVHMITCECMAVNIWQCIIRGTESFSWWRVCIEYKGGASRNREAAPMGEAIVCAQASKQAQGGVHNHSCNAVIQDGDRV